MTCATRVRAAAALGIGMLLVSARPALTQAPQDPVPAPVQITVNVTAEDQRHINNAIDVMKDTSDPFLTSMSSHLPALAKAMAEQPNKIFTIGPLTPYEQSFFDGPEYLGRYHVPEGTIHIRYRYTWGRYQPNLYHFTPPAFMTMLAAVAKGPMMQVPETQRAQVVMLGRLIVDFNIQAGGVISDTDVLHALAFVSGDKRMGERLVGIVRSMADSGGVFILVPPGRLAEFQKRAEPGFLIDSPDAPGLVKVRYGESVHSTRVDHLVWAFLRMFAGDNSGDWAQRAETRERSVLARDVLDYIEAQVRTLAVDDMLARLRAAPPGEDVPLGGYRIQGPVVSMLDGAPGVSRKTTPANREMASLTAQAKKIDVLTRWLELKAKGLLNILGG